MALKHKFFIISKDSKERIITSNMKAVVISDDIVRYINDSLQWMHSVWNDNEYRKGISYYGYSIIEGEDIKKLRDIAIKWKNLFSLAPDEFYLTGDFILDKEQYEKNRIIKVNIVNEFNSVIEICDEAIKNNSNILYNGI